MTAASASYWANPLLFPTTTASPVWSPSFQSPQRQSTARRDEIRSRPSNRSWIHRQRGPRRPSTRSAVRRQTSTTWSLKELFSGNRGRGAKKKQKIVVPTWAVPPPTYYQDEDDLEELNVATLEYSTHVPLSHPMDYRFAPSASAAATGYARTRSAPMPMPGYNHRPSRLHRVYPDDYNIPTTSHPLSSSHQRFGNGYLRGNGHVAAGARNSGYSNGNTAGYSETVGNAGTIGNNVTKYPTPPSVTNNDWSFLTTKEREHRTSTPPNVRLLREINQRAKVTEKSLVYTKVLGFVHLLLGLALISLEWAKLLLVWPYLDLPERKLALAMRALYPLYIVVVGTTTMATGIVNRKGATQLMMVSILAMLAPFFVLPSAAPFVTSVLEAMQVARAKDVLPGDDDPLAAGLTSMSSVSPQMIQSAMHNRFIKYLHAETLNGGGHPLGITDLSRVSIGNMATLQHLLAAFSAFSIFHCIVAIATLVVGWRLLHVQ